MTTGRRDVLKMMAGAALSTVAAHDSKLSGQCKSGTPIPCQKPGGTIFIINGNFILGFRASDMVLLAPRTNHHEYHLGNCTLSDPTSNLTLVVTDSGPMTIEDYGLTRTALILDYVDNKFDSGKTPAVSIVLPYPKNIYAHRLLDIAFDAKPTPVLLNGISGALALEYDVGAAPTITSLSGFAPVCSNGGYIVFFTAGPNAQALGEPSVHAKDAWKGLKSHFQALPLSLFASDRTFPRAPEGPPGISDDVIEAQAAGLSTPEKLTGRSNDRLGAANCKSSGCIVTNMQ